MGLLAAMPRKEARCGESTQDGDRAVDTIVKARKDGPNDADRPNALGASRDGLALRPSSEGGPVKTSHTRRFHPAGCLRIQSRPTRPIGAEQPPATPVPASEPASAPILSPGSAGPDLPQAGRQSQAAAWQDFILAKRQAGLSAKRIHQDLTAEFGAGHVSYDSVRRLLKRLGATRPLPFRRPECRGAEAQIDFGTGAPIVTADGKRRKTHVFRIVLSHSRKAYSEACFRQTTDDFLRSLENAFWYFGRRASHAGDRQSQSGGNGA